MRILFLGKPSVGKGTYAQVLKDELGIPHISSGDLLREESKKETALGRKVKEAMQAGQLVSDEIIIQLIKNRIVQDDCRKGFILDGFPRTKSQAQMLDEMVDLSHVLHFKADDEIIIERVSGRIVCPACKTIFHRTGNVPKREGLCDHCDTKLIQRDDDRPEVMRKRLELDAKTSKPLIDHYKEKGVLVEVVINKPISDIREAFLKRVKDFFEGRTGSIGEIK